MADSLSSDEATKNLTEDEDSIELSVLGMGGCAFQVQSTFSGTITFEGTVDGGLWVAMLVVPIGTTAGATTTTGTGIMRACCVGLLKVRARMSTYTSGYATVTIRAVAASPSMPVLS